MPTVPSLTSHSCRDGPSGDRQRTLPVTAGELTSWVPDVDHDANDVPDRRRASPVQGVADHDHPDHTSAQRFTAVTLRPETDE